MKFFKSIQEVAKAAGQDMQFDSLVGRNVDFHTIESV